MPPVVFTGGRALGRKGEKSVWGFWWFHMVRKKTARLQTASPRRRRALSFQ